MTGTIGLSREQILALGLLAAENDSYNDRMLTRVVVHPADPGYVRVTLHVTVPGDALQGLRFIREDGAILTGFEYSEATS